MKKSRYMVNCKYTLWKLLVIFFLMPSLLFAKGKVVWEETESELEPPWLTGPLIAPPPMVVPLGHYNIQPYIYATAYTGAYTPEGHIDSTSTFWNTYLQVLVQIGIASWADLVFTPRLNRNYSEHQTAWTIGDMSLGVDIQLYESHQNSWISAIKLALKENIPIGKYRNFNPAKKFTDEGGIGSWETGLGIVFGNLYHFASVYYLSYRLYLTYILPAPVHLKGFNFYGGSDETNVRFFPSQNFLADLGLEFTLSQNWAFALDVIGRWSGKSHYNDPLKTAMIRPRYQRFQVQYSVAPAVEYNWNDDLGIIAGAWFTIAGRNSLVFASGVFAVNYYK